MDRRDALLRAVEQFEATIHESAELDDGNFDANRRRGIELRRLMGEQRAKIGAAAEAAFTAPEQLNQFRSVYNEMRAAMAAHHAAWPLVSIELSNPDYRTSIVASREATRRFTEWVRVTLGSG